MSWDNIKEFFGSVAPAIGTANGGTVYVWDAVSTILGGAICIL